MLLSFAQYYAFYNYLVFMPRVLDAVYGLSASEKGWCFCRVGGRGDRQLRRRSAARALATAADAAGHGAAQCAQPAAAFGGGTLSLVALVVAVTAFGLLLGLSLPVQTSLLMDLYQHNAPPPWAANFFRFMGMATGPVLGSWLFQDGNLGLLYGFAAAAFLLAVGNAQLRSTGIAPADVGDARRTSVRP